MDKHLILSVISDDKPGIVKELAQVIRDNDGNWLESQLSQLAGKFAGVIHICINEAHTQSLAAALDALRQHGIKVASEELNPKDAPDDLRTANFSLVGPDRAGIVMEIAQAFSAHSINVENLCTECTSTPYSGEPLFEAEGELRIPADTSMDDVYDQLCEIADSLGMDISLEEGPLNPSLSN